MSAKTIKTIPLPLRAWTDNPTQKTTSSPTSRGFTLVEVLIVLAIISFVLSMGIPAIQRITSQKLNSTSRKFIGTLRTIRNDAVLLSSVHRLVVDLDEDSWWVESQEKQELISNPESEEEEEVDDDEERESNFLAVEKYSEEPIPLPDGVIFEGVYKEKEGLFEKGIAYVHFFPNGYVEPSVLLLNKVSGEDNAFTIELVPPIGKVVVGREHISAFREQ